MERKAGKRYGNRCTICRKTIVCGLSAFGIPTDERRKRKWEESCQMQLSKHAVVCSEHFLPTDIIKRAKVNNLMPSAVPSVNLGIEDPLAIDHTVFGASFPSIYLRDSFDPDIVDISNECEETPVNSVDAATQTDNPTNIEGILQMENEKYKALNKNLQEEIKILKYKLDKINVAITFMKTIFSEGQMRKIMSSRQVRWGRNDIANAIRLHASGPKAYNYLYKKGFPLPPVSTLEFWCRKVIISEGFLTTSLGFMKHCTELTSKDKICVLSFDEMKVVDMDENDSMDTKNKKPADCVQVVVAQGLWRSWKRPVFFNFDSEMKKDVLHSIISNLNKAKFPVVAVVCDLKPSYLKLWQELGVTKDKPWFPNPDKPEEKVFAFAAATHLLEHIKYQFLDTGLLWNNDLLSSHTIEDLMKHIASSNAQIIFELFDENLSVKGEDGQVLAEELFSKTTANNFRNCISAEMILYKSIETADLIDLVCDWFDVLSSTIDSFATPGKEHFGIALEAQQNTLMRMNKLMKSPIIPNSTTLEYFQEGILITNSALLQLHDYIKQNFNMTYILTNRITQHEIKHLLAAIRSKKDVDDYLTPTEFKNRLEEYIYAQNLMHFNGTANAETDVIVSPSSTKTLAITKTNKVADDISLDVKTNKLTEEISLDPQNKQEEVSYEFVVDRDHSIGGDVTSSSSSNKKVTCDDQHELANEIHAAEQDSEVRDDIDMSAFVEDELKYIYGYTFSE